MRPGPETALRDFEAPAFAQQQIFRRHTYVYEIDFCVPVRRVIVAEHRQGAQDFDAGGFHGHQNHGLLAVAARLRIGLAHENQDFAARIAGARGPPFAAVDHIAVAVAHDRGLDVGGIARSNAGFGHGKRRPDLAVEQRRKPALLLLLGGITRQHFHVAGIRRRTIEGLGSDVRTPHDFAQRSVFEIGQSRAMFGVRQKQIPQTRGPGFSFQILHHLGHLPRIARAPIFLQLLVIERLGRIDMLVHELVDPLL